MGKNTAIEFTELETSIEQQLAVHLQANHYPPVPLSMIPVCVEAIEAYWEDDTDKLLQLPTDGINRDGQPFQILWKGQDKAPAWAILEGHNLSPWTADYDHDATYDYQEEN